MKTRASIHRMVTAAWLMSCICAGAQTQTLFLRNGQLSVHLAVDGRNRPFISEITSPAGTWLNQAAAPSSLLQTWPTGTKLRQADEPPAYWWLNEDSLFQQAYAACRAGDLEIIWHVALFKKMELIRLSMEWINHGEQRSIRWFPVWAAEGMPGDAVHGWQALTYEPRQDRLGKEPVVYFSHTYSSDRQERPARGAPFSGQLPFWYLQTEHGRCYFSLDWSGGWRAEWSAGGEQAAFRVFLPEEETQLTLAPGEKITGPTLSLIPVAAGAEREMRNRWLAVRDQAARTRFTMPAPSFPLIYNHWYSVRFALSAAFLKNQIAAVTPYRFDAFVVDAGWYERTGDWTPSRAKFTAGEFEAVLEKLKQQNIVVGLWSCPWLESVSAAERPDYIDQPGFYREFMQAWALDLAGCDFTSRLTSHVRHLVDSYGMGWWKYDQEFLGDSTRAGKMKNIGALQTSLAAVRLSFPNLFIENCMSGGRMINGFTDAISQSHWIRDGSANGLKHSRSNIAEALGAVDFLAPGKVQRWTNRIDEIHDRESLRLYCRSAMIGTWGLSADLTKVDAEQQRIILQEIENYRKINIIKADQLYDVIYPSEGRAWCGIVYYSRAGDRAAALLFRWKADAEIKDVLRLPGLKNTGSYEVSLPNDSGAWLRDSKLAAKGVNLHLSKGRLSQIILVRRTVASR
ncbi:MAG: Melibiase [bacterium ADurb.Bin478]|nr:MAG: Melibiase [bacterium ADurb.Bin478]